MPKRLVPARSNSISVRFALLDRRLLTFLLLSVGIVVVCCSMTVFATPRDQAKAVTEESQHEERQLGPNLINNASAETLADGKPSDWIESTWSGSPVFEAESAFAHSGERCLKIHSDDGADASWSVRATVKRNTDYQLSAWIKTENVAGGGQGALLNLHELQSDGKSVATKGTQEWQQVTTEFNSGDRETVLVNMLFGGWGRATGTAWFDDVSLNEVMQPAEPVLTNEEALALFQETVLPIFKENCFSCHGGGEKIRGEFVMTNRVDLLKGGESGEALDFDEPEASLLIEAINYDSYEMPPSGKLPAEKIAAVTQWVRAGAPWKGEGFKPDVEHTESSVPEVNAETKKWWSYQPVDRPPVPQLANDWTRNDIDRFVAKRLDEQQVAAVERADKRTLIRRAYYDLTGLPPTPDEIREFLADESPDAFSKLVDRLLESPHYGEKWGRHWLDIVRYGESNSYERDGTKPFVWRYRDYVIRSFNDDKPYDMFLMEQLAGDEMDDVTPDRIIATGYYRLGLWDDEPVDRNQAWYDDMDDVVGTTSQAMLGMTINCARCHDHKIDPVPQEDYYRMLAFFRNVRRYGVRGHDTVVSASVRVIADQETQGKYRKEMQDWQEAVKTNKESLEEIEELAKKDFIPVEHEEFRNEMNRVSLVRKREGKSITKEQASQYSDLFDEMLRLRRERPRALESALCVKEKGPTSEPTFVMIRGNANVPGDEVQPGFPSVLSPPEPIIEKTAENLSTGRRMALACWVTDPSNPLTARVMVNRIWQHHFGRGIVRSSSDFGFQGTPPTHPALLDWLAAEFVESNWSIKSMHRLIMNSGTYQLSSQFSKAAYDKDPTNNLFWRYGMRRLTAEEIRDSIMAVNGTLNKQRMFGPSIFPKMPQEVLDGQSIPGAGWGNSSEQDLNRRSVYIHIKRSLPVPLLANFDAADPDSPCPVRFNTVQPTQALGMINSDFLKEESAEFAKQISESMKDAGAEQQVEQVLWRAMQRAPSQDEIDTGVKFIQAVVDSGKDDHEALRQFCLIALNLNEFLFLD